MAPPGVSPTPPHPTRSHQNYTQYRLHLSASLFLLLVAFGGLILSSFLSPGLSTRAQRWFAKCGLCKLGALKHRFGEVADPTPRPKALPGR
jgi:hypothetical protein